jgi:hypothetical protein
VDIHGSVRILHTAVDKNISPNGTFVAGGSVIFAKCEATQDDWGLREILHRSLSWLCSSTGFVRVADQGKS